MAALAGTAVGYAVGPILISRHFRDVPATGVITASLLLAAVLYTPFLPAVWPTAASAAATWSVTGLGVICTAIGFLVFFALIAEAGPVRATVITYVNPAVALALGVAILNEPFTAGMAFGFPLVILGSILATTRDPRPATEPRRRGRRGRHTGGQRPRGRRCRHRDHCATRAGRRGPARVVGIRNGGRHPGRGATAG